MAHIIQLGYINCLLFFPFLKYGERVGDISSHSATMTIKKDKIKFLQSLKTKGDVEINPRNLIPSIRVKKIEGRWHLVTKRKVAKSYKRGYSRYKVRGDPYSGSSGSYMTQENVILDEPELCFTFKLNNLFHTFKCVMEGYRKYRKGWAVPSLMYEIEDLFLSKNILSKSQISKALREQNPPPKTIPFSENLSQALERLHKEGVIFKLDNNTYTTNKIPHPKPKQVRKRLCINSMTGTFHQK